jgi:hypothetical protein
MMDALKGCYGNPTTFQETRLKYAQVSHNTASSSLTEGEHVPPPSVSNMENASLRSATSSSLSPCAAGGAMVVVDVVERDSDGTTNSKSIVFFSAQNGIFCITIPT